MQCILVSTEKYNFFNPEIPGFGLCPIPGFGIEKNVRDPGIRDPGITFPNQNAVFEAAMLVSA